MSEDNGKGYGCFVMLVSGVAIVFSIAALLRHDNWDCEISPAGFVIATLSALITFVVAWQIWQTIASREEIREMKDAAKIAEHRFNSLNHQLEEQRESIPHMIEATRLYSHAHTLRTVGEKDEINLREAYALYLEAIVEFLQSNPQNFVDRCLAGMERCQDVKFGAFQYTDDHNNNFVERCNRNYETLEGMFNRLTQEQREQIRRLREIRLKYHNPA